jgi:hypothetical protein
MHHQHKTAGQTLVLASSRFGVAALRSAWAAAHQSRQAAFRGISRKLENSLLVPGDRTIDSSDAIRRVQAYIIFIIGVPK